MSQRFKRKACAGCGVWWRANPGHTAIPQRDIPDISEEGRDVAGSAPNGDLSLQSHSHIIVTLNLY